jgi:cell division protein FtsI/penicillin-binding protein 2
MRRWYIGAALTLAIGAGGAFYVRYRARLAALPPPPDAPSISRAAPVLPPPPPVAAPLAGLDLAHIALDDDGSTAPLAGHRVARLTVEPALQRTAAALMAIHHIPEGAIVLIDVATGNVLAYASHIEKPMEKGPKHDLCAEATAPAASVFKIITGAALVETAGLGPDTKQCYLGGEQKILPSDLEDDPVRDRYCTTMAGAMGHSTNTVFARLALKNLKPPQLEEMAQRFGFEAPIAFDAPTEPSALHLPTDSLNYARTAAGFWNSTLSPAHAAWISAIVARGGEAPHLSIVREVRDENGKVVYSPSGTPGAHRVITRETAHALTTMMETTVSEGTSYRAFHDRRGTAFLPGVVVAGKTGTLTDAQEQRFYTWFTGFAPTRPIPGVRQVAIGVLVVNKPAWHVKANVIARELLREHFALQHVPSVSRPLNRESAKSEPTSIARRD